MAPKTYDSTEDWIHAIRASRSAPKDVDRDAVRIALVEAHDLLMAGPVEVSEAYTDIAEAALSRDVEAAAGEIAYGRDGGWTPVGEDVRELTSQLGARVRVLDRSLSLMAPDRGNRRNAAATYHCAGTRSFVIPRAVPLVPQPGAGPRQSRTRRALLEHRILPDRLAGYRIEPHWLTDIDEPQGQGPLGAAMFDDFDLKVEKRQDGTFRATGVDCAEIDAKIGRHLDAALAHGCVGVVWPELTMPPAQVKTLADALGRPKAPAGSKGSLQWAMAGSWHVEHDGEFHNVAPILDRYGEVLLRHRKSRPFRDNAHGREAIALGDELPVLLTPRHLIAFAICRDFCELVDPTPYAALGADLIVVASMAGETTWPGHRTTAHELAVRQGRSFIVQQEDAGTGSGKTGWVLPPVKHPEGLEPSATREGPWSVHEWERA